MDSWPEEVKRYYEQLAARRDWPPDTVEAFRDAVERCRSRDESERPRAYWRGIDPDDGESQWLFETVNDDDGRCLAVRQMVVEPSGAVHRYWWEHLEDEEGGLTDQPVDYTDQLDAISADEFARLWNM